ncbi:Proline-serine-threonine phosphatase-interacting protein, putative, partial [Pediculus humanus corporis]|uniref:Proline-serine-threonine phosphatase-interacting protein, putative n=2 Tax=Pediculus humanus subsp. corporis TaxID=121224 RepID=A0A1S4MMM4_PEDHC
FTSCLAFKHVMEEVSDLAGQHEVIAENLQAQVINEVAILVKDFREERKKHLQEGAKMMANLNNQINSLDRSKKNYEKAFKEAEKALENYQRAEADFDLSRAEVEKQRINMMTKGQLCEDSKSEYANQLQKTNDLQNQHYQQLMPDVFRHLQEMDEKRIKNIKNFMTQSVTIERNVFPIINKCLDGIINAANAVSEKEDTQMVIDRYKSGFQPPRDIPFEDLNAVRSGDAAPVTNQYIKARADPNMTVRGTISAGKLKRRVALFGIFSSNKNNMSSFGDSKEDYSDLPPNQRKKKLQQRIEELQKSVQQETAARLYKYGLMKMKGVYEQNPALGDPMSIEGQLNESGHKLDKLRQELHKFQVYLEEALEMPRHQSVGNSPSAPNRKNKTPTRGHSLLNGLNSNNNHSGGSGGEEESLSRSASDSSVHFPNLFYYYITNNSSSNSPESGLGTSHTSLPESDPDNVVEQSGLYGYEGEVLSPLGTCRALYPFEATSEGSIPMYDGEELYLIEVDQGDGWTRVRRMNDYEEGFVPTSYISCTPYT